MTVVAAASLAAKPPQQTVFSTRTDLVLAHATVLDSKGQMVKGLTSGDFVVKDNGVVVEAEFATADNVPLAVGIIMNREVLFYGEPRDNTVVSALRDMVAVLGPDDVIGMSNVRGLEHEMVLSRDPWAMVNAIRWDDAALRGTGIFRDPARSPWDALAAAAKALALWPGRRAILFVAGSEDWNTKYRYDTNPRAGLGAPDEVVARRPEPKPTVSTNDVEKTIERLGILLQVVRYDGGYDTDVDRLAKVAGGTTHKFGVREPLASRVNEIVERVRGSYLVSFKPARLDGKTHKLEIRTVRADLKVIGRTEYRAAR